jgi:hypothetical protein
MRLLRLLALASLAPLLFLSLRAEDVLFIGNSFTYGAKGSLGGETPVEHYGGVPKLLEAIAASKGKAVSTRMVVSGGKDWGWHLAQPVTEEALRAKPWDWVVLQDYSTKPTHLGDPAAFQKDGELFLHRIQADTPGAKVALYETWARAKDHPFYQGVSGPHSFADPAEMTGEIQKAYAALALDLKGLDPSRNIVVAPVGSAFALSLGQNPQIDLHNKDRYHASTEGYYLAALVIYATLFHDSPVGATREFTGFSLDPAVTDALQKAAAQAAASR